MVHHLEINRYEQPKWSSTLNKALEHLIKNYNQEEVWDFFEIFGTHVTIGLDLGAKYGYFYEMKASELEKMRNIGLSVEVGA